VGLPPFSWSFFLAERMSWKMMTDKKIKEIYKWCSEKAERIYTEGNDADIAWIYQQYEEERIKYAHKEMLYTKEVYSKRMLCTRELARILSIKSWQRFKSPIEVLAYYGATFSWLQSMIKVNQKVGRFTPDITLVDITGNIVLCIDCQGKKEHASEEQQRLDEEKRRYYAEEFNVSFVQVPGYMIKNEFFNSILFWVHNKVEEIYKEMDVEFALSYKRRTRNLSLFQRKA
jgi:hypothetical protein